MSIHSTALVDSKAQIGTDVEIGAYSIIGPEVVIGRDSLIGSHVVIEGDVQVGGFTPYPISYRSIIPREKECANLLVPICLSASHISYGSIRMEPVFMVLGQSAGAAAAMALDEKADLQNVDFARLRERLLHDHQVLNWDRKPR